MTAYRIDGPGPDVAPAPGRRPIGAKVLLILGAVMVLGAIIGFRTGTHRVVDGGRDLRERAERLRRELVVELDVPGRTTVRLRAGTYNIYDLDGLTNLDDPSTVPPGADEQTTIPGGSGTPVPSGEPSATTVPEAIDTRTGEPVVTITDVDGVEVEQTTPGVSSLADAAGGELLVQQQFLVVTAGTYTVEATGIGGGQVGIGRTASTPEVGRLVGGAVLAVVSLVLGGIGVLAVAGGLIWLFAGGRSSPPPGPPMAGWRPPPPAGFGAASTAAPVASVPSPWPGSAPTGSMPPPSPPPPSGS